MQESMTVLIAVIAVLITALIVLTVFGINIPFVSDFAKNVYGADACAAACNQYQYVCGEARLHSQLPGCTDTGNPRFSQMCECRKAK